MSQEIDCALRVAQAVEDVDPAFDEAVACLFDADVVALGGEGVIEFLVGSRRQGHARKIPKQYQSGIG